MRKTYVSIEDVLRSPWVSERPTEQKPSVTDRVLRSTRLEDSIYADLRGADEALDAVERTAGEKLRSFPALSRDVYQSFYSLMPRRREDAELSAAARKFNAHILDHIIQSEDYPTLKAVCEGRELPAYEAASEFITRTAGELDDLLGNIGGEKGSLHTLEKLEQAEEKAAADLAALLDQKLSENGYDAEAVTVTVSTAGGATADALAAGGVDIALLPAEDFVACEDSAAGVLMDEGETPTDVAAVTKAQAELDDAFQAALAAAITDGGADSFLAVCRPDTTYTVFDSGALQPVRDQLAELEAAAHPEG